MGSELASRNCVPCEGGAPPFTAQECEPLLAQVPEWQVSEGRLARKFKFRDFKQAMDARD